MNTAFFRLLHGELQFWPQTGRFDTSSLWSQMRHFIITKKMKIVHKNLNKISDAIFFPQTKSIKSTLFQLICRPREGVQCCVLKGCFYCCLKVLCPWKTPVVQIFHLRDGTQDLVRKRCWKAALLKTRISQPQTSEIISLILNVFQVEL